MTASALRCVLNLFLCRSHQTFVAGAYLKLLSDLFPREVGCLAVPLDANGGGVVRTEPLQRQMTSLEIARLYRDSKVDPDNLLESDPSPALLTALYCHQKQVCMC